MYPISTLKKFISWFLPQKKYLLHFTLVIYYHQSVPNTKSYTGNYKRTYIQVFKEQKGETLMYISLCPVEFPPSFGLMGMDTLSKEMT